jgi:hypothetical protein
MSTRASKRGIEVEFDRRTRVYQVRPFETARPAVKHLIGTGELTDPGFAIANGGGYAFKLGTIVSTPEVSAAASTDDVCDFLARYIAEVCTARA